MTAPQIESIDTATSTLTLSLDVDLYPRDVLYAAAYIFLDRAYVLLDQRDSRYLVSLRSKQPLVDAALRSFAGEFENELLAQALRHRVVKANQRIIEEVTHLAIGGAARRDQPPALADPMVEEPLDFIDDPLGLGAPWEPTKEGA